MLEVLRMRLEDWGFRVETADSATVARKLIPRYLPDIVISDVIMPEVSGLELLAQLKAENAHRPVILITAHASVDVAVDAIKEGAQDFLTKPLDYTKLKAILEAAQIEIRQVEGSQELASQLETGSEMGSTSFIGMSPPVLEILKLVGAVADRDTPVFIHGESGTGKEMVARLIHERSHRRGGPFIAINAAAIPRDLMESEFFGHEKGSFTGAAGRRQGCFELANKGVLFLDEIAEMAVALQAKLLRTLENGRIRRLGGQEEIELDVRVLVATNRDPQKAIEENRLRGDLYYRLSVFSIPVPTLRERMSDLPLLSQFFVNQFNEKHDTRIIGIRDQAMELLQGYSWPGNVRELKNVIERAVILAGGKWIEPSHLPPYLQTPAGAGPRLAPRVGATAAEAEKELILATLEQTGNNKAEAARLLDLDVKTIRNKLKSYGQM